MNKVIRFCIIFITLLAIFINLKYFAPNIIFVKAKQEVKALNCLNLIKDGYIIFVKSNTKKSKTIETLTNSKYNHLGVIIFIDGEPFVFSELNPESKTPLPLFSFINNSTVGLYEIRRLKKHALEFGYEQSKAYKYLKNYDCFYTLPINQDLEMNYKPYSLKINFLRNSKFHIDNYMYKMILRRCYIVNINPKEFLYWPTDIYDYENLEPIINKN